MTHQPHFQYIMLSLLEGIMGLPQGAVSGMEKSIVGPSRGWLTGKERMESRMKRRKTVMMWRERRKRS